MKRCIICLMTVFLLLLVLLGEGAIVPGRFTGTWYLSGTKEAYTFREGIISKNGGDSLEGAYAFARNVITLFLAGQKEVSTLYWIPMSDGDILCADPAGEQAIFSRKPS